MHPTNGPASSEHSNVAPASEENVKLALVLCVAAPGPPRVQEFVFSGERFSLSAYNSFPHLDSHSLLTYR